MILVQTFNSTHYTYIAKSCLQPSATKFIYIWPPRLVLFPLAARAKSRILQGGAQVSQTPIADCNGFLFTCPMCSSLDVQYTPHLLIGFYIYILYKDLLSL